MSPRTCPITGHPLTPTQYAAPAAAGQLRAHLADLPWLMQELQTTITRQAHFTTPTGSHTHTKTPPLPYHLAAAQTYAASARTIRSWSRHWAHTWDHTTPPDTWAGIRDQLTRLADQLTRTPDGTQCIIDTLAAIRAIPPVIDRPPERIYAGPCPTCRLDLTAQPGAHAVTCPDCETVVDVDQQVAAMWEALQEAVLPAPDAAYAASVLSGHDVTLDLLRKWRERGRILDRGVGQWGQRLYLVGDVVRVARDWGRKGARPRMSRVLLDT